jgi:hypothetical protein
MLSPVYIARGCSLSSLFCKYAEASTRVADKSKQPIGSRKYEECWLHLMPLSHTRQLDTPRMQPPLDLSPKSYFWSSFSH